MPTILVAADVTPKREKSAAANAIEVLRDPSHVYAMTSAELRAIGAKLGLAELAALEYETSIPLEHVLRTSFPAEGMLERVRSLLQLDAQSGADALGFGARMEGGEVHLSYPMTMIMWQRVA